MIAIPPRSGAGYEIGFAVTVLALAIIGWLIICTYGGFCKKRSPHDNQIEPYHTPV